VLTTQLADVTVHVGRTVSLGIPTWASADSVTWTSSNQNVALVDSYGRVSGLKPGSATVTGLGADGQTLTVGVRVIPRVTTVVTPLRSMSLTRGTKITVRASAMGDGADKATLRWTSSTPSVVSVTAKGRVTAKKAGTARLTVTAENGVKTTVKVTVVTKSTRLTQIRTTPKKTLWVGQEWQAAVTPKPVSATNLTPRFTSSRPSVISVDAAGRTKAKKAGRATITVRAGSVKASFTVRVKARTVAQVTVNPTAASLKPGSRMRVAATVGPKYAPSDISWISANPAVATVDSHGMVEARAPGTTVVTAQGKNGKKGTIQITVT
jgi:uncharacterized protein YjdB